MRLRAGSRRKPPWRRVDAWARRQPESRWEELEVRAGEKGPLRVRVLRARVQTRSEGRVGPVETVAVIRTREAEPRTGSTLSHAGADAVPTAEIARAHGERHRIEEALQEGKGEVGLGQYEVRSWTGWHHHMTLCLLALVFIVLERVRLGKKIPAVSVSQVRALFTELLRQLRASYREIARKVSAVPRRNEESRIYAWHGKTGQLPPRKLKDTG